MRIDWSWKTFEELSKTELYKILQLRNEIFVVEKNCPWNEIDGQDPSALHLVGYDNSRLVAYARLMLPKNDEQAVNFGRVLVVSEYRGKGISNIMMENIMNKIASLGYQSRQIDILANLTPTTTKLYGRFGFIPTQKPYVIVGGTQLVSMSRLPSIELKKEKNNIHQHRLFNASIDNERTGSTYKKSNIHLSKSP